MYIRIKKIKGKEYAYLVKSKWYKTRTPKQKTIKYLGRVYKLEKKKNSTNLEKFLKIKDIQNYIKKTLYRKLVFDIIRLELHNHNFKPKNRLIWYNKDFIVDLRNLSVLNKTSKKQISLELNKNFLNEFTLNSLVNFKEPQQSTKLQIGNALANSFISAGISINKSFFVEIFQKKYKDLK